MTYKENCFELISLCNETSINYSYITVLLLVIFWYTGIRLFVPHWDNKSTKILGVLNRIFSYVGLKHIIIYRPILVKLFDNEINIRKCEKIWVILLEQKCVEMPRFVYALRDVLHTNFKTFIQNCFIFRFDWQYDVFTYSIPFLAPWLYLSIHSFMHMVHHHRSCQLETSNA